MVGYHIPNLTHIRVRLVIVASKIARDDHHTYIMSRHGFLFQPIRLSIGHRRTSVSSIAVLDTAPLFGLLQVNIVLAMKSLK
jgi:hypothetical protein